MRVIAWLVEGTWPACVDAVRAHAPDDAEVVLLHVSGPDVPAVAHGAFAGLLGRDHPRGHRPAEGWGRDPGDRLEALGGTSAAALLDAAAERLGRPCAREERSGRVEREVVAAAEGAGLLVLARDGDRSRLGPKSLGPAVRFAVDHAPCPVLLVWPEPAPDLTTMPPPPPHRP
ncbi:universal stress protein [Streptomyces sp. 5-8]|uniref:Universal stress protein n=1 Tax=Streptomyces musisoli TaxID=2802280 RepID=A0ABS1NWF4_9ACTN|nr:MULTISPECIES: universal stress protein [Streptomyces]MBL1104021.1 universal stress protein [Streptomyces musisoli]MBY8840094.1 universal stress protein [Streptomyces sp. SP2-10]